MEMAKKSTLLMLGLQAFNGTTYTSAADYCVTVVNQNRTLHKANARMSVPHFSNMLRHRQLYQLSMAKT